MIDILIYHIEREKSMVNLTTSKKIDIFAARHSQNPEPYRSIAKRTGVSLATLHYTVPQIRKELENALNKSKKCSKRFVVKVILTLSLLGQMSSRGIAQSLQILFGKDICHDTVLSILALSSKTANEINKKDINLKGVKTALFDEIFQSKIPILGFTDHYSGFIVFKKSDNRTSKTWEQFLLELKANELNPITAIIDGGTGLKGGLKLVYKDSVVYVLDLFHALQKLTQSKNKMEGICYSFIVATDKMISREQQKLSKKYLQVYNKMDNAIELFDKFEKVFNNIAGKVYLSNKENNNYFDSVKLQQLFLEIVSLAEEFYKNIRKHKVINAARSYIQNNIKQLIAYKQNIENEVLAKFPKNTAIIFNYFLPIVEGCDQFLRSYENRKKQQYWAEQIISLKNEAMKTAKLTPHEFDKILNDVNTIALKYAKSNSLIENINNQVRRYLDTYKQIPHWFCDLFCFYWNYRVFTRGKRKGWAPIELLQKKKLNKSWIDLILDNFPYEKIKTNLKPI